MEDYSNAPPSISELRSDRTGNASDWAPRDALIDLLRMIDSGELDIEVLCIAYGTKNEISYRVASPNAVTTLGVMYRVLHMINERLDD